MRDSNNPVVALVPAERIICARRFDEANAYWWMVHYAVPTAWNEWGEDDAAIAESKRMTPVVCYGFYRGDLSDKGNL
jgi:hypothetical protein